MFHQTPERTMHRVRWVLASAWLILIFSLLYDPISFQLTDAAADWSLLQTDPAKCIPVQNKCASEVPYGLGAPIFWGMIVPAGVFILLFFGHELWRRICPLSFLSQIPRALGWQRQIERKDSKSGKVRYELAKVRKDSWLAKNYFYVQFGWLFIGLCGRILFFNSDRLMLALWLLGTIAAAIAVGYFYGGKSWCQYFCPMAPVQKVYAEPAGLLTSKGHASEQTITQSMCRIVDGEGKEQSACVACQNPCIDIDSERSYWEGIKQPESKFLYYGYLGLAFGYFTYYYLYAGNWDYYFSGIWARSENQLAALFNPGFYLFDTPIPIPKLLAVPLTLALSTLGGYLIGRAGEKAYTRLIRRTRPQLKPEDIQHQIFTLCTFVVFNFFFIFGGRPYLTLLPTWLESLFDALLLCASSLWLYQTWRRNPDLYSRESFASRFRKQLSKLNLNIGQFLEGRSLQDLNPHEVYVLAKVLPGFTREKRYEAYKGVVRDALAEGYVNSSSSLQMLEQMRQELEIPVEDHRKVLAELGVEDPKLLCPDEQRNRENLVRLTGFRKALNRVMALQQQQRQTGSSTPADLIQTADPDLLQTLRLKYSITAAEESEILETLDQNSHLQERADLLLPQLQSWVERDQILAAASLDAIASRKPEINTLAFNVLRTPLQQRIRLIAQTLLEIIATLTDQSAAGTIASRLSTTVPTLLPDLADPGLVERLAPDLVKLLSSPPPTTPPPLPPSPVLASTLEALLREEFDPLTPACSLYLLHQVAPDQSRELAQQLLVPPQTANSLLADTAHSILKAGNFSGLEKLLHLFHCDFFAGLSGETLISLAERAEIRDYQSGAIVTEMGDTCRELLLLLQGEADIHYPSNDQPVRSLRPGELLDELEVLGHTEQVGTITAQVTPTRILAVPVDTFDDLLERDSDFARRVLELESRRLRQLLTTVPPVP
uniref:Cyclic nucleotide-binding protein n=1 Tax=Cyanothece sp. (strain PCC 7425 / ATCC 29141) TaxID=395961 RepID=B8HN87_CYAP4